MNLESYFPQSMATDLTVCVYEVMLKKKIYALKYNQKILELFETIIFKLAFVKCFK